MPERDVPASANPPVLAVMTTYFTVTDEVRRVLDGVAPGIEVHEVPYFEEHALRNARAAGRAADADLASAPELADDAWAILERATAAFVLDVPDALAARASRLRWVQTLSAGTDHIDVAALAASGVVVTNAAGTASGPIADFVMGRLIEVWRGFRAIEAQQADRQWQVVSGRRLAGLTLGIVGLGAIGRATAKRARAFDMRVVANRRSAAPGDTDPDVDELFTVDELDRMLEQCDAVVLAAAATPESVGMLDRARIDRMKPGAVLVNVARGSLVDEDAIVDALHRGHLGAAVLDATAEEPVPADSPLWDAPNCYVSPHTSAAADGGNVALLELLARNLGHFVRDERLDNVVSIA